MTRAHFKTVIPAQAGIQRKWIPAYAGMTDAEATGFEMRSNDDSLRGPNIGRIRL